MEDKEFEENAEEAAEKMEETIHIEEDDLEAEEAEAAETSGENWTEEFVVAGEELVETVKELIHEANVRRIIIKNEEKRVLFEIPLVMGLAGIALLPYYAALALIAALVTDCTIAVERVETA